MNACDCLWQSLETPDITLERHCNPKYSLYFLQHWIKVDICFFWHLQKETLWERIWKDFDFTFNFKYFFTYFKWSGILLFYNICGTKLSLCSQILEAFGFCEYKEPESTLRALRLLHELLLGDKKLLVKVDAKTKAQLDEWKAKKRSANGVRCSPAE